VASPDWAAANNSWDMVKLLQFSNQNGVSVQLLTDLINY